ncbi:MAG: hypothetical protein HZC01_01200 [Candidatus Kerfeldbacteria bacterium]|nr:hypothetical protein [Candidatus Kerfeldbacteria bacterium]
MKSKLLKRRIAYIFSRYFIFVVIGCVVLILGLGYLFFVQRIVTDIQEAGVVDLNTQLEALNQRRITLERLEDLETRYRAVTHAQIAQLQSVLPHESEIPQIMIELKDFVADNELSLVSIDSGPLSIPDGSKKAAKAAIKTLNISLGVQNVTSYSKMKSFLDAVSTQLPLLELTSLAYDPDQTNYTLNLTLYYQ